MKSPTARLTVTLSEDLRAHVRALARQKDRSEGWIVRAALLAYLRAEHAIPEQLRLRLGGDDERGNRKQHMGIAKHTKNT